TFAPNDTTEEVVFGINDDNVYEGDETQNFILQNPSNAAIDAANDDHTVTIKDDESQPTVQFAAANGNDVENSSPHTVSVTLSGAVEAATSVNYSVTGGTAAQGATVGVHDYTLASGTVSFASLDTSEDISIV